MAWRMAKVLLNMLKHIFGYFAVALTGRARRDAYLIWAYRNWSGRLLRIFGADLEVVGREHFPGPGAPRVLLSNHQSQLDIPALGAAIGEVAGFVAKKELGRVPVLAYWMRQIGCVFIDRRNQIDARRSLEEAAKTLGAHPLVVFPEGTRSKTGQLLPVKLGGIRMAVLAGARIVPVHILNSRAAVEARSPGKWDPVPVRLRFFPPLDAKGWPDGRESWEKVKEYLEKCWAEGERGQA